MLRFPALFDSVDANGLELQAKTIAACTCDACPSLVKLPIIAASSDSSSQQLSAEARKGDIFTTPTLDDYRIKPVKYPKIKWKVHGCNTWLPSRSLRKWMVANSVRGEVSKVATAPRGQGEVIVID